MIHLNKGIMVVFQENFTNIWTQLEHPTAI